MRCTGLGNHIHVDEVINSYLTLRTSFQGMSQNGGRTTIKPFTINPAAFTVLVKCHIRNKIFRNIYKKDAYIPSICNFGRKI
jgi:hypothetical protein